MSSKWDFFSLLAPVAIFVQRCVTHFCKFARGHYEEQFCGVIMYVVGRVWGCGGVCVWGGALLAIFLSGEKTNMSSICVSFL